MAAGISVFQPSKMNISDTAYHKTYYNIYIYIKYINTYIIFIYICIFYSCAQCNCNQLGFWDDSDTYYESPRVRSAEAAIISFTG